MIGYLIFLFVLCLINCTLEILDYKYDTHNFNLIEFLISLTIGIFCLLAIFYYL